MPHDSRPTSDATTLFSNRVADYVRCRPGYPLEVVKLLRTRAGLGSDCTVADIGAGTGIFTRLLLATGATVHAIEPNDAMREALVAASAAEPGLHAGSGTGEASGLPEGSIDLIVAAQAFHWFDRHAARREFQRILQPEGVVALIWNSRSEDASPFLVAYEQLLRRWATDYGKVNHRKIKQSDIEAFFTPGSVERKTFPNTQDFDFEGLCGRLLSSSYAPAAGHPNHRPMLEDLRETVAAHQQDGRVAFAYETEVYLGRFR